MIALLSAHAGHFAASTWQGPAPVEAASGAAESAWLIFVVPLLAAGFLLLMGKKSDKWGHWVALLASWFTFVYGAIILVQMLGEPAGQRRLVTELFTWITAGELTVQFGTLVDPLSMTFVMLVSLVGSLIMVYSVGYMEHDPARRRFFAYMSLFIASMMVLVLGNSYTTMFFGWEGVGLSSYLLIGFWNQVPEYATAAKKAFVMNRVGDVGFLIAMMAMVQAFATTNIQAVNTEVGAAGQGTATVIGLALLLAAAGKSAQFPLQAWLGDAMAGPTPVSALIHAATMVTAGVYLVVRSGPIYLAAPVAMSAVAIVGLITLVLGALIGCVKDDIKKALAASTMSQVGYMMLGAGLGPIGWAFAIFHLLTHGFFKALMFLGAGSVMHAMDDQVNMRRFGGLGKYMKITFFTFMAGWISILGIIPFSGYWSKDPLIEAAFSANTFAGTEAPWIGWLYGLITMAVAGITSFYMSRIFFMTFTGKARWTDDIKDRPQEPQESKPIMTIPMVVLAVFALGLGGVLSIGGSFVNFLSPAIGEHVHAEPVLPVIVIQVVTLAIVLVAAYIAWVKFGKEPVKEAVPAGNAYIRAARNDFYQDQVNEGLFMWPSIEVMKGVTATDRYAIDGAVNGLGKITVWLGKVAAWTESGYLRAYAGYMLGGVVLIVAILFGFRL